MYSEIEATEFPIAFVADNATLVPVPGPSGETYDMQVFMKMSRDKFPLWTAGMTESTQIGTYWDDDILPKTERWALHAQPTIYVRGSTTVAVVEPEGIVFKRARTY